MECVLSGPTARSSVSYKTVFKLHGLGLFALVQFKMFRTEIFNKKNLITNEDLYTFDNVELKNTFVINHSMNIHSGAFYLVCG